MKLFNVDSSPYCARVRYFVYASSLPVDIVKQDYKDPNYKKVNPLGKVPALQLDNGDILIESEVIIEYLADLFRAPVYRAIQPSDPQARARSRTVARLVDLYIGPHTFVLYERAPEAAVKEHVGRMHHFLDVLERFGPNPLFTKEARPVAGDLALGLFLVHAELLGKRISLTPFEGRPALRAFYDRLLADPEFVKVRQQTIDAFAASRAQAKAAPPPAKL